MSQVQVFMRPAHLVELLLEAMGGRLVFLRFDPNGGLEFVVPAGEADPAALGVGGDHRAAYLSLGGLPKGPRDYDFLDREGDRLVEVSGGRANEERLELATIRLVSKKSKLRKQFAAFKKQLRAACHSGVTLGGHPYPDILWEAGVERLKLTDDWESSSDRAVVISRSGSN